MLYGHACPTKTPRYASGRVLVRLITGGLLKWAALERKKSVHFPVILMLDQLVYLSWQMVGMYAILLPVNFHQAICRSGGIGRRSGLKIHRWRQRAGSSPAFGTMRKQSSAIFVAELFCMVNQCHRWILQREVFAPVRDDSFLSIAREKYLG